MYFGLNQKNNFLVWAEENKIKLPATEYQAEIQYLQFEDIPAKEYYNNGLPKKEQTPDIVTAETLIDDKATGRIIRLAGDKLKCLGKYGAAYMPLEKQFSVTCQKPHRVFESWAISYLMQNIATHTIVIDRNTDSALLITTPKAWEDFKKSHTEYLAGLGNLEPNDAKVKQLNDEYERIGKELRDAISSARNAEDRHSRHEEFEKFYQSLDK